MVAEHMKDDGNCQFRALAHQLHGDQELHARVRGFVIEHIQRHAEMFQLYCDEELDAYIRRMSKDRTWGDELTMKAAVDAYRATVHVISSNEENWHLVYTPEEMGEQQPNHVGERTRTKLFVAYISPVHYNSIVPI
eukprot:TRINITY_DN6699_c0_g1_i5.p2 TRINITY_DN6699_c0_g1~~TRINITY_DN6699_c0_g1_i5.p2  ORF type:complete len:136 (+),score=31.60 TRINITY_DN6699_c0_g1_i5:649-1056(+)